MPDLPFRTNTTSLTDDDLILLDILFAGAAPIRLLRREDFCLQWNVGYSHHLNDNELRCRLEQRCEEGILETREYDAQDCFRMTVYGGELWSQERCPVWERFCMDRYNITLQGRTLMSVVAVSPEVRDDFFRLWPMSPARRRVATIADDGLIPWHPFSRLYVGVAIYSEQSQWTSEELDVYRELQRAHRDLLHRERSWWRSVSELQRFTPDSAVDFIDLTEE